jgi:hypothetical protein
VLTARRHARLDELKLLAEKPGTQAIGYRKRSFIFCLSAAVAVFSGSPTSPRLAHPSVAAFRQTQLNGFVGARF